MVYNTLEYIHKSKRRESFATIDGINYREKINLRSTLNYIILRLHHFVDQHLELNYYCNLNRLINSTTV